MAIASLGVMTGTRFLAVIGAGGTDSLPGALVGVMFLSTVLTYVLFAVGSARVAEWPRDVGLLVVAPAVLLVMVLVASVVIGVTALEGFVISAGLALAMVSLGYTLRTGTAGIGQADRTGNVTGG